MTSLFLTAIRILRGSARLSGYKSLGSGKSGKDLQQPGLGTQQRVIYPTNCFAELIKKAAHELLGDNQLAHRYPLCCAPHLTSFFPLPPVTSSLNADSYCKPLQMANKNAQEASLTLQDWEKTHKLEHFRALPYEKKKTRGSQHLS